MAHPPDDAEIAAEILRLTAERGPATSICPSEVARAVAGGGLEGPWRPLMGPVRQAAFRLAREGRVEVLRKGRPVAPEAARGVIRLRAAPAAAESKDDRSSEPKADAG